MLCWDMGASLCAAKPVLRWLLRMERLCTMLFLPLTCGGSCSLHLPALSCVFDVGAFGRVLRETPACMLPCLRRYSGNVNLRPHQLWTCMAECREMQTREPCNSRVMLSHLLSVTMARISWSSLQAELFVCFRTSVRPSCVLIAVFCADSSCLLQFHRRVLSILLPTWFFLLKQRALTNVMAYLTMVAFVMLLLIHGRSCSCTKPSPILAIMVSLRWRDRPLLLMYVCPWCRHVYASQRTAQSHTRRACQNVAAQAEVPTPFLQQKFLSWCVHCACKTMTAWIPCLFALQCMLQVRAQSLLWCP